MGGLRPFPTGLFFLTLVGITSRGLFEIIAGKTLAYGIQAALVVIFVVVLLVRHHPRRTRFFPAAVALGWLLLVVALISVFLSSELSGIDSAPTYSAVMLFFGSLLVIFSGLRFSFSSTTGIAPSIVLVVLAMIAVALLQQFGGLTLFPGTDLGTFRTAARPSAMTGSFLHYPISLALLSLTLLGIQAAKRQWVYLVVGTAGLIAVVISYSRSGMVIVLAGLAIGVFLHRDLRLAVRTLMILPAAIIALLVALPVDTYLERFLSIFQTDGAGNAGRIEAWAMILNLWAESPLVFGSHAGEFTNITSNLSPGGAVASPESGVLQLLVSFGLIGVVAYYGLMVVAVAACPPTTPWYRAALLAGIAQSVVYQSVEVLPFMVFFALVPFIGAVVQGPEVRVDPAIPVDPAVNARTPRATNMQIQVHAGHTAIGKQAG